MPRAAVRVFAPPADRVRELFAGYDSHNHAADRKVQEQEKKKAYAAELQAQMQERQAQRQEDRFHRLGAPAAGAQRAQPDSAPEQYAASGSLGQKGPPSPRQHLQQQQQQPFVGQHQQPDWQQLNPALGSATEALAGPGSYASSNTPPWLQHTLQHHQQQPPPSYGLGAAGGMDSMPPLLQQQHIMSQQPFAGWPAMQQQQQGGFGGWPGGPAPGMMGLGGYGSPAYTTTAVAPSCNPSLGSNYSPGSISPNRGFQAGGQAAAAIAAMQAAARSGGPGSWGASPTAAAAAGADAPFSQQQWPAAEYGRGAGGAGALGYASSSSAAATTAAAAGGGTSLGGLGGSSPPTKGRNEADKARKDAYRAELEAQIQERAKQKAAEKSQRAAEEARKEAEMAAYCPWGRAGAGAPLRDATGQMVTSLRGAANQQQQQQQQLHQWQQQHDHQQQQQEQHFRHSQSPDLGPPWQQQQQQQGSNNSAHMQGGNAGSSHSYGQQDQQYQQQQQQHEPYGSGGAGGAGGGAATAGGGANGPAPVLCFRSDKAFMTSTEIEARQRQQRELQQELDRQVQDKKRQKELQKRQEEEEARQEEARLAAEQARLASQFQAERDAEHGKRSSKAGAEGSSMSGGGAKPSELQTSKSEGRRRVSILMAGDEPSPPKQPQQQQYGQDLLAQPSRSTLNLGYQQQQLLQADPPQQQFQQLPPPQQQFQQPGLNFQQQLGANFQQQLGMQQQQQLHGGTGLLDNQQRQAMLYEALQLEGHPGMQQMQGPNLELGRLRRDMDAQAAALRSAVESQGREVAALRATAAAAEAESAAAKAELAQVKRDMARKSQELPHETLSTMLADYGDGPASALLNAAYHPNPIRRIDLELPPSAAALRRSIELQARSAVAAQAGVAGGDLPGSSGSAVDLLESILQQGRSGQAAAAAGRPLGGGGGAARSASVPAAGAGHGGPQPGWLGSVPLGGGASLLGSMLAAESTFILPAGLQVPAATDGAGEEAEMGGSSMAVGGGGSGIAAWDAYEQQGQAPAQRTTSAPGYSSSKAGMPLRPTLSSSGRNRDGLVTPGGSDLMAVVNRNADKLRVLQNVPESGSSEALDQFLATFVAQNSQPKQPTSSGSCTPVSRLMTPQVRTRPHRYSNSAADSILAAGAPKGASAAVQPGSSFRRLPDVADSLDLELSRMEINKAAAMGHDAAASAAAAMAVGRSSHGYGASTQAQQRLLLAGTAAGIGAAAAAAGGGASSSVGLDW